MLDHILFTLSEDKSRSKTIIKELSKQLKTDKQTFNRSHDWISALNYCSINKKPVIWLDWSTTEKYYHNFYKELQHLYPRLPVVIYHQEKTIPKDLCTKNKSIFAIINENNLLDEIMPLVTRLNIYYDFLSILNKSQMLEIAPNGFGPFIGNSTIMLSVYQMITKVACTDYNVLITGASGTGKELTAQTIHRLGDRKQGPFISINCAAIPDNLLESELFGYEKGAFTDATQAKPGKFELADKGTIFLDEIGDMPLNLQTKLLRVLEDHKIERLGGTKEKKIDIRLIAATNWPAPQKLYQVLS